MGYIEENGTLKYSESPSKMASAWQGYDLYPGIDQYQDTILKKGTLLVKLEPSSSGYFIPYEKYLEVKEKQLLASSKDLSQGVQV